jgi:hypothetical protein
LFDTLDAVVGQDQWVAALSSDHGVTPIPEQLVADGKDAGRVSSGTLTTTLEQVLHPLGKGRHVSLVASNDVYFEPDVYENIQQAPELLTSVIGAITGTPGVAKVFRSEEVRGGASSADPLLRAAALSYFPGRSGDLIIVLKPGWMFSVRGTTHGSATADDQQVPLLLLGPGIKPGRYAQPVTPADIAPTLAHLCGITLSSAEGRVLAEAVQ